MTDHLTLGRQSAHRNNPTDRATLVTIGFSNHNKKKDTQYKFGGSITLVQGASVRFVMPPLQCLQPMCSNFSTNGFASFRIFHATSIFQLFTIIGNIIVYSEFYQCSVFAVTFSVLLLMNQ